MILEISIAKENIGKMSKGTTEVLRQGMTRRVSNRYEDVEVIVKSVRNDRYQFYARQIKTTRKHLFWKSCRTPRRTKTADLCVNHHVN